MKILFLTQYFVPEMGAAPARVLDFARHWKRLGHDVTVLTAFPNHPTGHKPPGYRRKIWMRDAADGLRVLRTYVLAVPNRGYLRLVGFLSFMASSVVLGALFAPRPDVLIATSPPFFAAVAGWVLSRLKRCPLVFEVRDLWPQAVVEVGAMRRGFLFRMAERMEMFLYRRSARIVVVTEGIRDTLVARGIPPEKILFIPNGVDVESADDSDAASLRERFGLDGKFVVSYVGTLGMSHGLEILLSAAALLRDEKNILFLVAGAGAEKERLMAEHRARRLPNVRILPEQPRAQAARLLVASDAVAVPLRKLPLFAITIPSKMFEAMAARRPLLLGVDGEARAIMERAGAGLFFEPENPRALADAVLALRADPSRARAMGEAGRKLVEQNYDRRVQAERYADFLREIMVE